MSSAGAELLEARRVPSAAGIVGTLLPDILPVTKNAGEEGGGLWNSGGGMTIRAGGGIDADGRADSFFAFDPAFTGDVFVAGHAW